YCVRYIRAWMLQSQITETLESKFGKEWFADPQAGKTLISLWSSGQSRRAEHFSKSLGFDSLNFDLMIKTFLEGLS
ncbi:MAG TPA: hypothetical protein PLQ76_06405, partial [bacterium]|nr:hypothetical protein [bacterium]